MTSAFSILLPLLGLLAIADDEEQEKLQLNESRFVIEVPDTVLTDVPVKTIIITALDADGNVDKSFNERVLITGVVLTN